MRDTRRGRKIVRPALPSVLLHREELVSRLSDMIGGAMPAATEMLPPKLVLLQAPAGYGKTTLLADFARQITLPCCWYMLGRSDTNTTIFLETLLASIRECFPHFGAALDPLLAEASVSADRCEAVVQAMTTAIAEITARFVLVLCNFHEVNGCQPITRLIDQLLRLPSACVLVLESRAVPDLDFAPLLAQRKMVVITRDLLRLSSLEIQALAVLQGVPALSDAEAEQMAMAFDGWMMGILLGTRLGDVRFLRKQTGGEAALSSISLDRHHLFAYVLNEVFQSHPAEYAFLKEACILEEMTPALCAALLELPIQQTFQLLASLEQYGLFVRQQDEASQSISTCHPALRDLLVEELRLNSPTRFKYLHQRAAELLGISNNHRQAVYHALAANANDLAASLIIETSEQMIDQGYAETLARWIDAFPPSTTKRSPQLLLIRANIYLRQGNARAILPLLDIADTAVQAMGYQVSSLDMQNLPVLQAEIAIVRSKVLFRQKECQSSKLLCQQVLANLPTDEVTLRAEAHMRLGLCHIQLGDFTTGIAQIQKALQLWGRHTIRRQTADGHSVLARAYGMLGNFALAEHHMTRALACWERLQDSWGKIDNLVRLGNIKVRQGVFPEAETIFQEALALASGPIHYQRGQAYALDCLGIYYQRQERYERALVVTEEALALARQLHDQSLLHDTLCDLAMLYLFMGDTATALMLISEVKVQTMSGDSIGYEQAICDLIYGTIHLFQGQYSQAWPYLSASEATLNIVGLKQEHLQALLRLAACHIAQEQLPDAIRCLEAATAIVPICEGYERMAQMEMRHLPGLVQALKTLPELAQVRTSLHLEVEPQATQTHEKLPFVQEKVPPQPVSPILLKVLPHTLTILALGEPAVSLNQEPVTRWRMARAMELFFFLLDCGRPMRKEQILTALWAEVDEQTDHTLHSTIYYVRKALGDSCIVSQRGTYALNLAARYGEHVEYDVTAFQNELAKAKQALTREDTATARTALLALVDLYRGDYVEPFYSEWCRFRRDELRQAYLDARHQLAQLAWGNEQFDESAQHWQHLLAVDNCQEEAHYGLMRCYLRQGKRGLALRQYQRCCKTLHQELGVQPGPAMQHLYQRLVTSSAR